jgi:hypothetical protein
MADPEANSRDLFDAQKNQFAAILAQQILIFEAGPALKRIEEFTFQRNSM